MADCTHRYFPDAIVPADLDFWLRMVEGKTPQQQKSLIMTARQPEVGAMDDNTAQALIAVLGLEGA